MGSKHGRSTFEEENFNAVAKEGEKVILYNPTLNKSIEKHQSAIVGGVDEVKKVCQWRAMLSPSTPIVQVYEYGIKQGSMCNGQSDLYVVTERIHLFKDIVGITQPESFLLMKEVLKGVKILFQEFGSFTPMPNIFGVNNEGKTKVWINENFACHRAEENCERRNDSELVIVNNMIRMVEQKVQIYHNKHIGYPFNLNFKAAINYIDRVMEGVKGFEIDRVYLDREEYEKGVSELREKLEREEKTKLHMRQCEKKTLQIQKLQQLLKQQQVQLANKNIMYKAPQPIIMPNVEAIDSQSQKKVLGWTASTNRSAEIHPAPAPIQRSPPNLHPPHPPQHIPLERIPISRQILITPKARPNMNGKSRQTNLTGHESLRKEIQLVDSMILVEEDLASEQHKKYIESRVVGRPGSRGFLNL